MFATEAKFRPFLNIELSRAEFNANWGISKSCRLFRLINLHYIPHITRSTTQENSRVTILSSLTGS